MSPGAVRAVVLVICAAGIAGMIASSIADSNGAAVTFGLITAVAVLCLMVATAVARSTGPAGQAASGPEAGGRPERVDSEVLGADIEARVRDLVAAGANEDQLRQLLGQAVRLGRATGAGTGPDAAGS